MAAGRVAADWPDEDDQFRLRCANMAESSPPAPRPSPGIIPVSLQTGALTVKASPLFASFHQCEVLKQRMGLQKIYMNCEGLFSTFQESTVQLRVLEYRLT